MPPAPAAAAAGYRPRPAQNQLKEIVEEKLEALLRHGDERFRDTYGPLHRRVRTVLEDFLALLVPHIVLRYEVTIRSYGALSTTYRKKVSATSGW